MNLRIGALLLFAALAAAEDDLPLISADGTSLETFEVKLRLDAVDHGSPEALAKCFVRFEEEQHAVKRKFAELVRDAHLALLRTYYAKDLVDRQATEYEAIAQKGYHSEVTGVTVSGDKATATVRQTYVVGGKEREGAMEIDLVHDGKSWWITSIRVRGRDGKFVDRPLGVPPPLKDAAVPAPGAPDLSSAKATIVSLRDHALRFGALRERAFQQFWEPYFEILAAFNGQEAARKARAGRPQPKAAPDLALDVSDAMPRLSDLMRVEVTVKEKGNPIGQEAFDLRAEDGAWKVAGEYRRPQPDAPYQGVQRDFGLFFIVGQ